MTLSKRNCIMGEREKDGLKNKKEAAMKAASVLFGLFLMGTVGVYAQNVTVVIEGEKGDVGEKGDQGEKGDRGDCGSNGEVGPQGPSGADGSDGLDGINGTAGTDGVDGVDGVNGTNGKDGKNGANGAAFKEDFKAGVMAGFSIRLLDTRKFTVSAFNNYDVRNERNDSYGLNVMFKLGQSYEEKLIKGRLLP